MSKKKSAANKSKEEKISAATSMEFTAYLDELRTLHEGSSSLDVESALAASDADESRGACLIKSSALGSVCIRTTPAACKAMKGVFIGGPCGG